MRHNEQPWKNGLLHKRRVVPDFVSVFRVQTLHGCKVDALDSVLNPHAFDFADADVIAAAVVEAGGFGV